MTRLHDDELPVDAGLARRLVDAQLPAYAGAPLRGLGDSGSSNALFRLGDDALVRLPRQPGGGADIGKEATWLPHVAERVSVGVPRVLAVGRPDAGYPERWSVTSWHDGVRPSPPQATDPGRERLAHDLVGFLAELRGMEAPAHDADLGWYRGGPLAELDDDFRGALATCRAMGVDLDLDAALSVWEDAVEASSGRTPGRTWFHGDLLAENLLLDDSGGLAAVLDFGGLAVGDPTVDLVVGWEVLDAGGREVLRAGLAVDDATWATSRGWALLVALITFPYYGATMPRRCADRLAMARAALAG